MHGHGIPQCSPPPGQTSQRPCRCAGQFGVPPMRVDQNAWCRQQITRRGLHKSDGEPPPIFVCAQPDDRRRSHHAAETVWPVSDRPPYADLPPRFAAASSNAPPPASSCLFQKRIGDIERRFHGPILPVLVIVGIWVSPSLEPRQKYLHRESRLRVRPLRGSSWQHHCS